MCHQIFILIISIQRIRGQEEAKSNQNDGNELFRMMLMSFLGACITMVVFVILKVCIEYRNRNRPTEEEDPFGRSRRLSVADLTLIQRKAVIQVLFTDDNCVKYYNKVSRFTL